MRILRALAVAAVAASLTAGVVLATHTSSGLGSSLLARGTWARADRTALLAGLARQGTAAQSEVAVVRATLAASGYTDWHGHPGPSVVVVTAGTLTVFEPTAAGGCTSREYRAGEAFFHAPGSHDFRNLGAVTAEFYITYFVDAWPPLIHTPGPVGCT